MFSSLKPLQSSVSYKWQDNILVFSWWRQDLVIFVMMISQYFHESWYFSHYFQKDNVPIYSWLQDLNIFMTRQDFYFHDHDKIYVHYKFQYFHDDTISVFSAKVSYFSWWQYLDIFMTNFNIFMMAWSLFFHDGLIIIMMTKSRYFYDIFMMTRSHYFHDKNISVSWFLYKFMMEVSFLWWRSMFMTRFQCFPTYFRRAMSAGTVLMPLTVCCTRGMRNPHTSNHRHSLKPW